MTDLWISKLDNPVDQQFLELKVADLAKLCGKGYVMFRKIQPNMSSPSRVHRSRSISRYLSHNLY